MTHFKLHIGITHYQPGWEIILSQIGVDWSICNFSSSLSSNDFSVIILNGYVNEETAYSLQRYVKSGGAVLTINGYGKNIFFKTSTSRYYSTLHPNEVEDGMWHSLFDFPGTFQTEENPSIDFEKGFVLSLPFDVNALIISTNAVRKNFWFEGVLRYPNEITAGVSKGGLRKLVQHKLMRLHHFRKLPFIHKWYFPQQAQTVFTFRVDTDSGTQEQLTTLFELCRQFVIPTEWFVDVQSHEQQLSLFRSFNSQEIGVHCYRHKIFYDYEQDKNNFSTAKQLLERQDIIPNGIALPYGTWTETLGKIIQELHFPFSSEFALNYDDLPFFPFCENQFSTTLQLPIHPVSIGIMKRARFTEDEMREYYLHLIDRYAVFREPICLYHHPTHLHFSVFKSVFEKIRNLNILTLSYSQYNDWWRKRLLTNPSYEYDATKNSVQVKGNMQESVHLRLTLHDEEIFIPSHGIFSLEKLSKRKELRSHTIPQYAKKIRRFDWRHLLINILEKKYKARQ
ncbi:MAG: hypothetical protein H3C35_02800 [Bacteroidetes bacterium]|nr:hypothetical protein [Bacteroidota bacterium]